MNKFKGITFENDDGELCYKLNDSQFIQVDKFDEMFGTYIYDELINHELTSSSWKVIFNEWKEKGMLD